MVRSKKKSVVMAVDDSFFDNLFEPARRKAQADMKLPRLTQRDFTRMLFKSGLSLNLKIKTGGLSSEIKKPKKRKKR